jgi:hypothetical protein
MNTTALPVSPVASISAVDVDKMLSNSLLTVIALLVRGQKKPSLTE